MIAKVPGMVKTIVLVGRGPPAPRIATSAKKGEEVHFYNLHWTHRRPP